MSAFFLSVYLASSLEKFLNTLTFLFVLAMMIIVRGSTTRAAKACRLSSVATLNAAFCDAAPAVSKRQLQN
jgi:hypothetical protein